MRFGRRYELGALFRGVLAWATWERGSSQVAAFKRHGCSSHLLSRDRTRPNHVKIFVGLRRHRLGHPQFYFILHRRNIFNACLLIGDRGDISSVFGLHRTDRCSVQPHSVDLSRVGKRGDYLLQALRCVLYY